LCGVADAGDRKIREATLTAYWLARARIVDPVEYKKYTDEVPGIIAKYGGKVLARGGRFRILEGPENFERHVVIQFPSLEEAEACFNSPEYREAAAFRRAGAGINELVIVESGDATT
jgi:uncharacterized protein (DUF1330 family)